MPDGSACRVADRERGPARHAAATQVTSVERSAIDTPGLHGNQLENTFWAGAYTGPTPYTEAGINIWEAIHHGDGVKRTALSAFAQAHTRKSARIGSAKRLTGSAARTIADIGELFLDPSFDP